MPNDPIVFPTSPTAPQVPVGLDNVPRMDPSGNFYPEESSNQLILRAIYFEIRLQSIILAEGLNVRNLYDQLRRDVTSVYPDSTDQV